MDVNMEASPSNFDGTSFRSPYRRYGKSRSASSSSPQLGEFIDEKTFQKRPNIAVFLEDIKQESEGFDFGNYGEIPEKSRSSRRKSLVSARGDENTRFDSNPILPKFEYGEGMDMLSSFATLVRSAMKGFLPVSDLILKFEALCRDQAEFIRYDSRMDDKLMGQKADLLLQEAASWSLMWHLYGKENEGLPEDLLVSPITSHIEACLFAVKDMTAQHCLRIVQWLEELASKALDLEARVRGSYMGTYLPTSGVWYHTQQVLKKGTRPDIVEHLDFDATTREGARLQPDDEKQDECLLEDVWTLLRAGRREEACELCRSAGQPWRAVTILPFGESDHFPSMESFERNGKNRGLQAIELHNDVGHHYLLWRWACYTASESITEKGGGKYEAAIFSSQCSNLKHMLPVCLDWESACWAMAKSWLEVRVDLHLSELCRGSPKRSFEVDENKFKTLNWPSYVLHQQPRNLDAMLQKLHSTDTVHEAVVRECKVQHRQIEMNLILCTVPRLLDLIWSWISPSVNDPSSFKPHGDPQMISFGAHLVFVIRRLFANDIKGTFKEKVMNVGDLILQLYTMFLFTKQHEELVGIYASQLAGHRCIDLFVHMMELRLHSDVQIKYKIFISAIEHLPFSPIDDSKGSYEGIIERVLSRSREMKYEKNDTSVDIIEQHRKWSIQKAMAIQWLCFTPPSTIPDVGDISVKLLSKALIHGNILLREFSLMSMWRGPEMPIAVHTLLSLLAEPLKLPEETRVLYEDADLAKNLKEFQDWCEYFSCDAAYRNWLKFAEDDAKVSPLSMDEKQRTINAAKETWVCSTTFLSKQSTWLVSGRDEMVESAEPLFIEMHAIAIQCNPSGESLLPDATLCAALTTAFYSTISEEVASSRRFTANVVLSPRNSCCIEVSLRCLAVEGDGIGLHEDNDGGILAMAIAAGFKGEFVHFQPGVTMEISQIDSWYSDQDGCLCGEASYVLLGLCRRCCIPEVVLRCMQISVFLMKTDDASVDNGELIELVASSEMGVLGLFNQHQLQEFLLFEREYSIWKMHIQLHNPDVDVSTA